MNVAHSIVLFTAQDIGYRLVNFLAARSDVDALVVTMRTARDVINGYRSAIEACDAAGIKKLVTSRVDEHARAAIATHRPEFIISAYYPAVIPPAVIALAPRGAVNVHPGILPSYRGRFPTPWYILNGETHFGVAIHQLDRGIDTGDVLVQKTFEIAPDDTGSTLYRRSMDEAGTMLIENFDALLTGQIQPIPQRGVGSYYRTIEKRFHIDWNVPREQIERRVRVHARPYFPAYSFLFNRIVLINRVRAIDPEGYSAQGGGEIIEVRPDGKFVVSCSDGCLLIEDYTIAPELKADEFTLHVRPGHVLE